MGLLLRVIQSAYSTVELLNKSRVVPCRPGLRLSFVVLREFFKPQFLQTANIYVGLWFGLVLVFWVLLLLLFWCVVVFFLGMQTETKVFSW